MDIVRAARKELADVSALTTLLGSSTEFTTWLFRWNEYVSIEGTGSVSVVLRQNGSWTSANRHNTARFPRLQVAIYADPDRTTVTMQPTNRTTHDKVHAVFAEIDKVLHRPDGGGLTWGDINESLRVVSSHRAFGDLEITEVPGKDGVLRGLMEYDITLG